MAASDNLRKAKEQKNDEFYTQLEDIEAEISSHPDYVRQFQDKIVLCNCDDPEWSSFYEFFRQHFNQLGLKKLITTHFNMDGSPSYKLEWSGEKLGDDTVNMIKTPLQGNGDFRSDECIELLKEADIVVTNPPFSLFREYIALLEEYGKKWIVIGNKNAIAYKEFFPLLRDGKAFVGYNAGNGTMHFATKHTDNGIGAITNSVPSYWYTNFDIDKTHEELPLNKNYKGNENNYPRYYNYDAIDISAVKDIPKDYYEPMGVPITFLANFCSEQFEIIGIGSDVDKFYTHTVFEKNGEKYIGYFDGDKEVWSVPYSVPERKLGNSLRLVDANGNPDKAPYNRIIIRRKKVA